MAEEESQPAEEVQEEQSEAPEAKQLDNGNWEATCSECGGRAEVPFKPDPDRPVYCKDCFSKKKSRF